MYIIKRTKSFAQSFRKIAYSGITKKNKETIEFVIDMIASGQVLSRKYRDHQLSGEFKAYRECHILNDLLLIYRIEKDELVLVLVDIGSHSQLFG